MPPAPAPRPERDYCANCGFPIRGNRCDACGTLQDAHPARDTGEEVPTKQTMQRPYAPQADADVAGLERAIEAFRAKDIPRFIEHLVSAESANARIVAAPDGHGWVAPVRGALVFVTLRAQADEVVLEAPIARLPVRQRLPALRLALELCAQDAATSRVSLRGELLLLRFTARTSQLTPPVLRYYLREIGHLASRYASVMTVSLDALPALPDEQRGNAGFDALGRPKKIQLGAVGSVRRSMPPPAERSQPGEGRPARFSAPPAAPSFGVPPPTRPLRQEETTSAASAVSADTSAAEAIPAILSPSLSPSASQQEERNKRSQETRSELRIPSVEPARRPASGVARAPEIELDAGSRRPSTGSPTSSAAGAEPTLSPSDRLCMLLRHAQSLASLALEERPASLTWLMRSTVFRAIYDFKDTLPDAVAHLYRCTGVGRDAPGSTRSSSSNLQVTEPALVVMERVIVARAQMPKEKALAIEPMTSASQAKDHVARYLTEIDRAPGEPGIRHFLALGALTELLVRTKLPPQTDQRLRDIVAHAQREGSKLSAIELMMTALQRINS